MSPALGMDASQVKRYVYERVYDEFGAVIAVSVEEYPNEYSVTIWTGSQPSNEWWRFVTKLEADLAGQGIRCNIAIKTDRELPFGERRALRTKKGDFEYRYFRLDSLGDEAEVFLFVVYRGAETYRFRLSLTGTLDSQLRMRGVVEEQILRGYSEWVAGELERGTPQPEVLNKKMFNSRDMAHFTR